MPDISLCKSWSCNDRMGCYRYRAEPNLRQSYLGRNPRTGSYCPLIIPVTDQMHVISKREMKAIEELRKGNRDKGIRNN